MVYLFIFSSRFPRLYFFINTFGLYLIFFLISIYFNYSDPVLCEDNGREFYPPQEDDFTPGEEVDSSSTGEQLLLFAKFKRRLYWQLHEKKLGTFESYDKFKERWNPDTKLLRTFMGDIQSKFKRSFGSVTSETLAKERIQRDNITYNMNHSRALRHRIPLSTRANISRVNRK